MTEVINPMWNIFEPPLIDKSIKSYEFKEYRENNVNVVNLTRYEITTKNSQSWKHLGNAYLYVKSKITNQGNHAVTVANNGLNDFKLARLFYENKLIEEIDYVGIATTIANLSDYSGDYSTSEASQMMWFQDTADTTDKNRYIYLEADKATKLKESDKTIEQVVQNIRRNPDYNRGFLERLQITKNGSFCKFIPLKRLFRFCHDINKVLKGEIKIVLEKNHNANILHTGVDGVNFEYQITDLSVWIPEVEPSLSIMATLESHLASNNKSFYGWNALNCYRSDIENSSSGTWRVVNSQHRVNGVYIVFAKVTRDNNLKKSNMVFDHNNLDSIHCRINGKQYPMEEFRCSFEVNSLDYARIYSAFIAGSGFKQDDMGTCVSRNDYMQIYPIIYFDLTKQEDEPFSNMNTSEVEVRWRLKQFTENYHIYAVIQSERKAEVQVLDQQLYLTM